MKKRIIIGRQGTRLSEFPQNSNLRITQHAELSAFFQNLHPRITLECLDIRISGKFLFSDNTCASHHPHFRKSLIYGYSLGSALSVYMENLFSWIMRRCRLSEFSQNSNLRITQHAVLSVLTQNLIPRITDNNGSIRIPEKR